MKSISLFLFAVFAISSAQISLNRDKSAIKISGTSSLHDWEMTVEDFDVAGRITEDQVTDLKVSVTAKSMKSGKTIMDEKAYDAVQAEDYATIYFSAESLQLKGNAIEGQGKLQIANKSREIDFSAKIIKQDNKEVQIQGAVPLKMSDFEITPPTAMFGTLKTGDEVVIGFDVSINKY